VRDHRSLEAWRQANLIVHLVLDFQEKYWRPAARNVFDQLGRAALSIQLNIAEGHALRTPSRFRYHLEVAYGSAVETSELLEILSVRQWAPKVEVNDASLRCSRTQALVLGLVKRYRAL